MSILYIYWIRIFFNLLLVQFEEIDTAYGFYSRVHTSYCLVINKVVLNVIIFICYVYLSKLDFLIEVDFII